RIVGLGFGVVIGTTSGGGSGGATAALDLTRSERWWWFECESGGCETTGWQLFIAARRRWHLIIEDNDFG
ncbi:hypothetical protein IU482_30605, partial [Nocardia farcinica]|nr:hypothetical protein [Nocardia farcinica]